MISLAAMMAPIPQLPTPIILESMGACDGIPKRKKCLAKSLCEELDGKDTFHKVILSSA